MGSDAQCLVLSVIQHTPHGSLAGEYLDLGLLEKLIKNKCSNLENIAKCNQILLL